MTTRLEHRKRVRTTWTLASLISVSNSTFNLIKSILIWSATDSKSPSDSASGATVRGCKKELSNFSGCTDGDNYCVDCDRSYCNAAAIPWWRIKCHQCEGVGCGKTTWENSKYCSKYEENDQCYSVIAAVDGDIEVYRGCMSDLETSPGKQFCEAQGENCSKCSLSECNSQKIETYGQCYFCDGITDPNCATLTGVEPIYCPKGDGEKEACFRAQVGKSPKLSFKRAFKTSLLYLSSLQMV